MKYCFSVLFFLVFIVSNSIYSQKTANVILEHSETLSFDKTKGDAFQVLKGNVRFRQIGRAHV